MIAEVIVEPDRTLERRKRLVAEIEELFSAHPFGRILGTLPGIGPRTGSRILAEIGDGSRSEVHAPNSAGGNTTWAVRCGRAK